MTSARTGKPKAKGKGNAEEDPYLKSGKCQGRVFGASRYRKHGCPCSLEVTDKHEDGHRCSCGGRWRAGSEGEPRIVVLESPPFPAMCGWGKRVTATPERDPRMEDDDDRPY